MNDAFLALGAWGELPIWVRIVLAGVAALVAMGWALNGTERGDLDNAGDEEKRPQSR